LGSGQLLLLCLIDLAQAGELNSPLLSKTPELRLRFDSYWSIVQPRWGGRPSLDLPFHHLATQGFWTALDASGQRSASADTTRQISIDPDFLACLHDPAFRLEARLTLIRTWFPDPEANALLIALGVSKAEVRKHEFKLKEATPEYAAKGRDARFRITVVTQHRFTCALTGFGVHTRSGATLVEAAHIHPFSQSRNDQPDNGLALSRDAHWMFDEHLWSVDERMRVVVAKEIFTEWGPEAYWLKRRHGQPLHFMDGVDLRPSYGNLARHFGAFASRS
jgi:putative restriction endonuclease